MKKKVLALVLAIAMIAALCVGLTACNDEPDFKVGFLMLHGEDSTYDKNFIEAARTATSELGLKKNQVVILTNVDETDDCANKARDLVDQGCDVIFADSFGHGPFMLEVAKEFPNVQFCHATGTGAQDNPDVKNLHNAFASIYEGRYLAGIVAGMKLNEMMTAAQNPITADQAVLGYVGAFQYAEIISGYTAFYLGAKSVCPSVTMKVTFTNEWYDIAGEKSAAEGLINAGCKVISQHADSPGAPTACEEKGVPNVSYNGSTEGVGPNTYLVNSKINWVPYFKYMITQAMEGKEIAKDFVGTLQDGSVVISAVSKNAAEGTQAAVDTAKAELIAGTRHVFDTTKFTITENGTSGQTATNKIVRGQNVIVDGVFVESKVELQSAPYFDLAVDGITIV